jgi:AcrR family transcriptional regulator
MSIERPARVRRSSEAARENILAACEAILLEKGPQALKLADVAAGAGVANATVLHHFGSVDGVQTALMARMIRQLVERIEAIEPDLVEVIERANPSLEPTGGLASPQAFSPAEAAELAKGLLRVVLR